MTETTYDTPEEAFAAFCEHVIATNPKGATMTTSDPAAEVARLAAETDGAQILFRCSTCGTGVGVAGDRCCGGPLGLDSGDFGPYYYFPPAKPAPPTSRETLAANVLRLRVAKGWTARDLCENVNVPGAVYTFSDITELWDGFRAWDPDIIDALAAALNTTPAALLTPETEA